MKTAIITGITGQDGAYLSKLLLEKGYRVVGLTRKYNSASFDKIAYLGIKDDILIEECDLLDISALIQIISKYKPDEIYNLAAQSSVSLSFKEPISTIQFNTISVLNLLEAIRTVDKNIKFYQASSSEMYGKVENLPVTEQTVIHPLSPYAVSKAAAHWTVVNYRESYNLFACCGVLFNHDSYLRNKDFFIKKIIQEAIKIKQNAQDVIKIGNIDVKRDFGYAPEYVKAIWLMLQQTEPEDYIICSGKSISLREILYYVFDKLELDKDKIIIDNNLYRPIDIKDIYGDSCKAKNKLNWDYDLNFFNVLDKIIKEEINEQNNENINSNSL